MSVNWLSKAWETETGSVTKKAVLIALADRCGEEGICWPSHGDIQRRSEAGRTTIKRALEELEIDGFIETWERTRPDGSKTSKGYRLLIDGINRGDGPLRAMGGSQRTRGRSAAGQRTEPSSEPSSDTSVRRRGATSQRDTRPRRKLQPRESDEPTSTDESPALGSSRRRTNDEVKETAQTRGTSGFGLALRLQKGLDGQPGALAIVDVRALAKRLNDAHRAGTSREQQAAMVELFVSNPQRYRSGDLKGWTQFLAAVPKLEVDVKKSSAYDDLDDDIDPYANHA